MSPYTATLWLTGDIDVLSQKDYREQADTLLAGSACARLVVDMRDVTSIDSSGLGLLVHLHGLSRENDVEMVLVQIPPRVDALLRRTGLNRVFTVAAG